jgi:hypothetical protein
VRNGFQKSIDCQYLVVALLQTSVIINIIHLHLSKLKMIYILLAVLASLLFTAVAMVHVFFTGTEKNKPEIRIAVGPSLEEGALIAPITKMSSKQKKLWKQLAKESYERAINGTPVTPTSPISPTSVWVNV